MNVHKICICIVTLFFVLCIFNTPGNADQVYLEPDGVFQSPSPRRFVQLEVKLGNDNPDVAPVLRGISLHFDDALISGGVTSRIFPRQVGFDSQQAFNFTLVPSFRPGDQGFDRVDIQVPMAADEVRVKIGGESVEPMAVTMIGDSLRSTPRPSGFDPEQEMR